MAKEPQELKWVEGLLPEDGYRRKAMFGGFSYYIDERMVLLTFESPGGSRKYKGQSYNFDLWNGCMFPVDHDFSATALKTCPFLVPHPILPKWLYLPVETENFDELVEEVLKHVLRPHSLWGSIPKSKTKKTKKWDEGISTKMDTRRPRMFSDEPAAIALEKAKKISDLKNLGPTAEAHLHKVGIKTPAQFVKLGWKKTLEKLVASNPKHRHSIFTYSLIGALKNQDFTALSEEERKEAREFTNSLKPAKKPGRALAKKTTKKKTPQRK